MCHVRRVDVCPCMLSKVRYFPVLVRHGEAKHEGDGGPKPKSKVGRELSLDFNLFQLLFSF